MTNRILIAYATFAGSTAEVAVEIGKTLAQSGFEVDVRPVDDGPVLEGYQAVLLGSAVQYARWLPKALDFVEANQQTLNQIPVGVFCVHIQNTDDDPQSRHNRLAYLDEVHSLIDPVTEGFFAGRFDQRGAAELLPKLVARFVPPIDLRNWDTIRAWADGIAQGEVF